MSTKGTFWDWLQSAANDLGLGFITQIKKNKEIRTLAHNVGILQAELNRKEISLNEAIEKFRNLVQSSNFDFHPALKGASLSRAEELFKTKTKLNNDLDEFNKVKKSSQSAIATANSTTMANNPTKQMINAANQAVHQAGLQSDLTPGGLYGSLSIKPEELKTKNSRKENK